MAEHTPGPWRIVHRVPDTAGDEVIAIEAGDVEVCSFCRAPADDAEARTTEERDARLIAAAPDLLAALRAFVDEAVLINEAPAIKRLYAGARAAIAKAEGRE